MMLMRYLTSIEHLTKLHPNGAPEMFDKHYVLVSLYITKMENFESAEETVFLEFSLVLWWRDKELIGSNQPLNKLSIITSLVGKTGDDFDPKKLWNPEIDVVGTFKIKHVPDGDKGMVRIRLLMLILTVAFVVLDSRAVQSLWHCQLFYGELIRDWSTFLTF